MRLRVTVEAIDRPRTDVLIEAEPEAPAGELLGALARHVGVPMDEAQAAYNERADAWLTAAARCETPTCAMGIGSR